MIEWTDIPAPLGTCHYNLQYRILEALQDDGEPGLNIGQLAERANRGVAYTHRMVQELAEAGLVNIGVAWRSGSGVGKIKRVRDYYVELMPCDEP